MPIMTDRRSIAIGASVENVLQGKQHEFLSRPSIIHYAPVASVNATFATLLVGNETHLSAQEISAANRFPVFPDDVMISVPGLQGERILVGYRNDNVAPSIVQTLVRTDPAA